VGKGVERSLLDSDGELVGSLVESFVHVGKGAERNLNGR
jgi:hypothetical protein